MGAKVEKRRLSDIFPFQQFPDFNKCQCTKSRPNARFAAIIATNYRLILQKNHHSSRFYYRLKNGERVCQFF
jgi:hypothetical protein